MVKIQKLKIVKYSCLICMWALFIAVPAYMENFYFNITQAKFHALLFVTLPFLVVATVGLILEDKFKFPKINLMDTGVLCLSIFPLISCFLSDDYTLSFWGDNGWRVGGLIFILLLPCYFILSRHFEPVKAFLPVVLVANCLILLLGILNSMGIDPFGLHENIALYQYYGYISTIGNVNWFVGYLCLTFPLFGLIFVFAEKKSCKIMCFIYLLFACPSLVLCASDGLILGLGVCAFFAIPVVTSSQEAFKRFSILGVLFGLSLLVIGILPAFNEKRGDINGIFNILLDIPVSVSVTVFFAAMLAVSLVFKNLTVFLKVFRILAFVGLGAVAVYFLVDTVLNFNDDWGTERGAIWRISFEQFDSFSVKKKIFGVGPEMLKDYYSGTKDYLRLKVLTSHSEPVQMLLTTGILGLCSWIFMWATVIFSYFKFRGRNKKLFLFFIPLMAYLGQSFVNSAQCLSVAVCFALLCLFRSTLNRQKNEII